MAAQPGNTITFGITLHKDDVKKLVQVDPQVSRNAAIKQAIQFYVEEKAKTPAA